MLNVKISSTVNGIASITVGSIDTRATHQACSKNSRHAKGLRGMSTKCLSPWRESHPACVAV